MLFRSFSTDLCHSMVITFCFACESCLCQLIRVVNLKPQDKELSSSGSSQEERQSVTTTRIPCVVDSVKERSLDGCQGKQLRNM